MAANEDWSREENRLVVRTGFELAAAQGANKAQAKALLRPRLSGRSEGSVDFKLENVSHTMKMLGLPGIPGYQGRPNIQLALVPEVAQQAVDRALLPPDTRAFDVMGIYAGDEAQDNLLRGLHTRTWGFPVWDPIFNLQPAVGLVLIASHFSAGSPRVQPEVWAKGTVDLHVCRFVGPFVAGQAPHWEDELASNALKYVCRFGIEPIAHLEAVSLAADGPLGTPVAEAIRRSASNRGIGKFVVRWDSDGLLPQQDASPRLSPSTEVMTDDLPATGQRRRRGLGRLSDAAMRRAVELRAMVVADEHFVAEGWTVTDTSAHRPWDFEATRGHEVMRIEVKGTTGLGTHVQLTAGEVNNALGFAPCALAVVSDVRLDTSGAEVTASGGRLHVVQPWKLDEDDLRPLSFEYRVPPVEA